MGPVSRSAVIIIMGILIKLFFFIYSVQSLIRFYNVSTLIVLIKLNVLSNVQGQFNSTNDLTSEVTIPGSKDQLLSSQRVFWLFSNPIKIALVIIFYFYIGRQSVTLSSYL